MSPHHRDVRLSSNQRSKVGMRLLGVAVSVVLLFLIFRRLDLAELGRVFGAAKWGWMGAAVGVFGLGFLFAAYRWHLMLRFTGTTVHPVATLRAAVIGHCFNTFLFGAAGGDVVKSGIYCRWYRFPMTDVLAMAPLDRLLGLMGAILFGVTMLVLGAVAGAFQRLDWERLILPIVWIVSLLVLVTLVAFGVSKWRGRGVSALNRLMTSLRDGGAQLLRSPSVAIRGLAAAFLVHLCLSGAMALNLHAVSDAHFSWVHVLWIFPVISMISGLPISVGGAGLREGTALVLLTLFNIPAEDAVAAALLTLALYFLWSGIGWLLWWREEGRFGQAEQPEVEPTISAIIPTLDEAEHIERTVRTVKAFPEIQEILIADGGSTDGTRAICERLGCRVITTKSGRGSQMRAAAKMATSDVVLLLHADTSLPVGATRALQNCLRDIHVVGGGYWKDFDQGTWLMAGSRFRCLIRLVLGRRIAGDQAMFVRRAALESIGGIPDVPLMEEFELCRQLNRIGRLALADATVITSGRRFIERGAWKTYLLMWRVTLSYYLGTSPHELAKLYRGK